MIAGWARRNLAALSVAGSLLFLVLLIRLSWGAQGASAANLLLALPPLVAVGAYVGLRKRVSRSAREWTTLALTLAIVYGVLASFSVRESGLAGTYLIQTAFTMGIFALLALGLSLQMGQAGLLNFGHVAFMGIGAYVVALWTTKLAPRMAPAFEGAGPGALGMSVLAGVLAGVIVYVPALLLLGRVRRLGGRARTLVAAALGGACAVAAAWSIFPADPRAAMALAILLGVLVAMAVASLAALALGAAALRLREDYLAIVTLGSAEIFRLGVTNARDFTNGSLGVLLSTGAHHMPISGWARQEQGFRDLLSRVGLGSDHALVAHAIVVLATLALALVLLETLATSPWGRALRSIRDDEEVASSLGKNVLLHKLQALMIGGALAALAGILFMWSKTNVYPTDFIPTLTFLTVAILVLGGIGNHKGAILGAIVLWGIFEFAGGMNNAFQADCLAGEAGWLVSFFCDFAGPKQQVLIGLVLVLVILVRPQGAIGNKEELAFAR